MNEILQNIMLFINEHTLLLIGICAFLILVLIGYLIDNSVKSKRIRKDIKNADQVPNNIKEEIIKQAEEKTIKKEDTVSLDNQANTQPVDLTVNEQVKPTVELSTNEQPAFDTNFINPETSNNNETNTINLNENLDKTFPSLDLNTENDQLDIEDKKVEVNNVIQDPDANIMGSNANNEYSNDKGLSEILFNMEEEKVEENNNIFTNDTSNNIVINNEVKKDDVQIQSNNSSEELDRIMRKLSTMNNNVEDDNYTNIF